MRSWRNSNAIYGSVVDKLLQIKAGADPIPELPDNLTTWLAQLTLLYGVPVEYLVPDTRMLPTESIRFFYMDRNWLDRLVDGAISVGVLSSMERIFNEAFYEEIYAQVDIAQLQLRQVIRTGIAPTLSDSGGVISGLLFRSCVVSGWPGLEVTAFANNVPLKLLRMDRLSDNVMLCLFYGLPDRVEFTEPGEGLHFGIIRTDATNFKVLLRGLGFPNEATYPAGKQITQGGVNLTANGTLLTGAGQEPGVVDILGLKNNIKAAMAPLGALPDGKLTPAGMAIQLVLGAGKQAYDLTSPECQMVPSNNQLKMTSNGK